MRDLLDLQDNRGIYECVSECVCVQCVEVYEHVC